MTNREYAEQKAKQVARNRLQKLQRQQRWAAVKDRVNLQRRKSYTIDIPLEG